jgi:hypothetical protein
MLGGDSRRFSLDRATAESRKSTVGPFAEKDRPAVVT